MGQFCGKRAILSGSGNVSQYCAEKIVQYGGKVLTMSDSDGFIHDPDGIDATKLAWIMDLKNNKRGRIGTYVEKFPRAKYTAGQKPWIVPGDLCLPCATQNEIDGEDAKKLVANGCIAVSEGANMPSTPEAVRVFQNAKILFGPAKAANAGGVATSALEMTQNAQFAEWTREQVDAELDKIMTSIHTACQRYSAEYGHEGNLVVGANIAGFMKVAGAMLAQGF